MRIDVGLLAVGFLISVGLLHAVSGRADLVNQLTTGDDGHAKRFVRFMQQVDVNPVWWDDAESPEEPLLSELSNSDKPDKSTGCKDSSACAACTLFSAGNDQLLQACLACVNSTASSSSVKSSSASASQKCLACFAYTPLNVNQTTACLTTCAPKVSLSNAWLCGSCAYSSATAPASPSAYGQCSSCAINSTAANAYACQVCLAQGTDTARQTCYNCLQSGVPVTQCLGPLVPSTPPPPVLPPPPTSIPPVYSPPPPSPTPKNCTSGNLLACNTCDRYVGNNGLLKSACYTCVNATGASGAYKCAACLVGSQVFDENPAVAALCLTTCAPKVPAGNAYMCSACTAAKNPVDYTACVLCANNVTTVNSFGCINCLGQGNPITRGKCFDCLARGTPAWQCVPPSFGSPSPPTASRPPPKPRGNENRALE